MSFDDVFAFFEVQTKSKKNFQVHHWKEHEKKSLVVFFSNFYPVHNSLKLIGQNYFEPFSINKMDCQQRGVKGNKVHITN